MVKYYIEVTHDTGCGEPCLLETKKFDTKEEALDWYHISFVTADTWECAIRLIGIKCDENGFGTHVSCEELSSI